MSDGRHMTIQEAMDRRYRFAARFGSGVMTEAAAVCAARADEVGHQYGDGVHGNRHDRRWLHAYCLMPIDTDTGVPWPAVFPVDTTSWGSDDDRYALCDDELDPFDVGLIEGVPVAMCISCRAWLERPT